MLRYFAHHPVLANLLMGLLLLLGTSSLFRLTSEFLPYFDLNFVTVQVSWPNANAADVERSLLVPLERELRDISNLKKLQGVARDGFASIALEFKEQTDMTLATEQTKTRVAKAQPLPSNAEQPIVTRLERFEPVAGLLLTGNIPFEQLKTIAYQYEGELLKRGIDKVKISGIPEEEILIEVPSLTLQSLGNTLEELGNQIQKSNAESPLGETGNENDKRSVRLLRQAELVDEFKSLFITSPKQQTVQLREIATIQQRPVERDSRLFYKGQPAIDLSVLKNQYGDTLKAAKLVHEWLDEQKASDADVNVIIHDQRWTLIQDRLNLLLKNGATGLLFILCILFVFLERHTALWIAVGIPVSLCIAVGLIYLAGGSINMITLFALIMTLGIIVDDTIVVGENALARYSSGAPPLQAAVEASYAMLKPVLASSLTTVAAFLPLLVISGIIGQILFVIPFVVICVILASLLECFFILPAHLTHSFLKLNPGSLNTADTTSGTAKPRGVALKLVELRFASFKEKLVALSMKYGAEQPRLAITSALCVFCFSISLIVAGVVRFTFFPTPDGNLVKLNATFVAGTLPTTVQMQLQRAEAALQSVNQDLLETEGKPVIAFTSIVTGTTADTQGDHSQKMGKRYGHINIELIEASQREVSNKQVIALWQQAMPELLKLENLEITSHRGGPPGRDIDIQLTGLPASQLKQVASRIKNELQTMTGVDNISDDLPYGKQAIEMKPNWRALSLQLYPLDIARQLQTALSGYTVQAIQKGREEVNVTIQLPEEEQNSLTILDRMPIKTASGTMIPASDVIERNTTQGFDELRHSMGELGIHITAEVNSKVTNASELLSRLDNNLLKTLKAENPGLQAAFEGRAREQKETLSDMLWGATIALGLIYAILVFVFASYRWPFVMLITLPLSISGAILGHWLLGYDLTILSLFGVFGLMGIVANDGIVLVTHYLRNQQGNVLADIQATLLARFRAVFLTSVTTIAGLTPLLFESSLQAQFLIPMAISITFGLAWAFVVILFVLPSLITLFSHMTIPNASTSASHTLPKNPDHL